jgi:hypothetical protein
MSLYASVPEFTATRRDSQTAVTCGNHLAAERNSTVSECCFQELQMRGSHHNYERMDRTTGEMGSEALSKFKTKNPSRAENQNHKMPLKKQSCKLFYRTFLSQPKSQYSGSCIEISLDSLKILKT